MKKRTLQTLGIAVVAAAALVPLHAQAWTIKVTGTLFDLPDGSSASTDGLGLFGGANAALAGDSYTETITTDPFLNSTIQSGTSTFGTTGASGPGLSAAPYSLTVTVNGISFVHDELAPSFNSALLVNSLSAHDPTDPAPYDLLSQSVFSGDCGGGLCLSTSIQALSSSMPFIPALDFNQTLSVAGGFNYADTGSYTAFAMFDGVSAQETDFYGSIDTLSVNPRANVPEPGALPLLAAGLATMGFALRRRTTQVLVRRTEPGVRRSRSARICRE